MAKDATIKIRTELALVLPDLFQDPDRILIDGPAKVDAALSHYLDELKMAMSSNLDVVESVEGAVKHLQDDTPKLSQQIDLLAASTKNVLKKNSESARLLRQHLLELSFNERALLALQLANICRHQIDSTIDATEAAKQLIRSQAALSRLREIVDSEDRELKQLEFLVNSNTASVVNSNILSRTFFEYVKVSKQTLSLNKKNSHLIAAFNHAVAILNAPEADQVYIKLKATFWNEFLTPIVGGVFTEVRCSSSERLDVIKIRRPTMLKSTDQDGPEFAILRLRAIETVLRLMFENVFSGNQSALSHLGRHLWADLSTSIVEQVLRPSVPPYRNALDHYRTVMGPEISSFIAALRRYHFVYEQGQTPLDQFLRDLDSIFGEIICTRFVARARALMMDFKFAIWNPDFKVQLDNVFEQSWAICRQVTIEFTQDNPGVKITCSAVECALLVHFLLEQASDSSTPAELSNQFHNAARAVLFVFESVSPVYHEKLFNNEPSYRSLYAINCLLLAHHMARAVVIYNQSEFLHTSNRLARAARLTLQSQRQWLLSSADHIRLRDKQIDALDVLNVLYKFWRQ